MQNNNMININIDTLADARELREASAPTWEERAEFDAWCDRCREDAIELMEADWGGDDLPM
jgi:hypothetical protein